MRVIEAWQAQARARRTVRLLAAMGVGSLGVSTTAGCRQTSDPPEPARSETAAPTMTASTVPRASLSLPYKNVAMPLPQPLAEPTPEQAPDQYEPAMPPWPDELKPVFGSELIERVKHSGNKGVLINVWATWCGPCKAEMPLLLEVREQYRKRGIDIWFVSVDKSEHAPQVLDVLKERGVPSPHFVARGRLGYFKEALSPIWKGSLPSTFLFDATGRVRYYWGAQILDDELPPLLDDYLAGKNIDGAANYRVRRGTEAP